METLREKILRMLSDGSERHPLDFIDRKTAGPEERDAVHQELARMEREGLVRSRLVFFISNGTPRPHYRLPSTP